MVEVLQLLGAWYLPVQDCDEIFNYWEPLHFLQYGSGAKVWEYSEDNALRSYLFLFIHYFVSIPFMSLSKIHVFKCTRVVLALFSILCQRKLVRALNLPYMYSALFSICPGILLAGHAFLPSTFAMNCIILAYSFFLDFYRNQGKRFLFYALLSCSSAMVIGWPFVAVLLGVFILPYLYKFPSFLKTLHLYTFGILALAATIIPSYLVDSKYYGKPVLSVLNVFLYNTSLGKNLVGSSLLFGVEPWHMYFKNLFLNFNFLFVLFLSFPGVLVYHYITNKYLKNFRFWLAFCLANFAWFALMTSQPHKEERFMYVIYPGIVLLGGFVLGIMGNKTRTVVLIAIGIVSASRILQVQIGYSGPMAVWEGLSAKVCVGGEWYTYPSNYYTTGELFYYSDGFKGLLPGKFGESFIMNNQNREEKDRYIPLESCEYVVALNTTEKPLKNELKSWKIEKSALYLDPSTKQPFRSFYLPLGKNVYGTYLLLKNPKF